MSYIVHNKKTWAQTRDRLEDTFAKWGVSDWSVILADPSLKSGQLNGAGYYLMSHQRGVSVRWVDAHSRREIRLYMGDQDRPLDNLLVLALAVEALRLNEVRGIGGAVQDAYLQLAGPQAARDPYEVLGLRSDCALEVAEGAWKAMAKMLHPDTETGDVERMKELNAAIERIRSERKEAVGA